MTTETDFDFFYYKPRVEIKKTPTSYLLRESQF